MTSDNSSIWNRPVLDMQRAVAAEAGRFAGRNRFVRASKCFVIDFNVRLKKKMCTMSLKQRRSLAHKHTHTSRIDHDLQAVHHIDHTDRIDHIDHIDINTI